MAREIPLTQGQVAIVDDEDFVVLAPFTWNKNGRGYAQGRVGTPGNLVRVMMHRFILQAPQGVEVDHINGDRLDNRRANLRLVTRSQNMQNIRAVKSNTGIRNVSWTGNRYSVSIQKDGKTIHCGTFATLEEAAAVAVRARKLHFTHSTD